MWASAHPRNQPRSLVPARRPPPRSGMERHKVHDPLRKRFLPEEGSAVQRMEVKHFKAVGITPVVKPGRADECVSVVTLSSLHRSEETEPVTRATERE